MKSKFYFLLAITTLLMACRDDENGSNSTNQINGKWNYSKRIIKSGKNQSIIKTEIKDECESKSFLEFTSTKLTEVDYALTNNQCQIQYNRTYDYNIDVNNYLNFDGGSFKIASLTNSELVILFDLYDYDKDGVKDEILDYYKN